METPKPPVAASPHRPPHWRLVVDQTLITSHVRDYAYPGEGTAEDPYVVDWLPDDPKNGQTLPTAIKWVLIMICAFATLACSLAATVFAGPIVQVEAYFGVSEEVGILTISLFVLGFAFGPIVWGPLSELYGRQLIFIITAGAATLFEGASIACKPDDAAALLVLRFLVGAFSSSVISNSPGVIADIFPAQERGLAMMVYAMFPFLGPTLGPVCGNFLAAGAGWKWVDAFCTILLGIGFFLGLFFMPETYAPYILRRRASQLSKQTGKAYLSKLDVGLPPKRLVPLLTTAITRPIIMAAWEPISTALALYSASIYGVLYLMFAAFPIIYVEERGWSQGVSGLAYLGIMVGQILAAVVYVFVFERRYRARIARPGVIATPEMRLEPAMAGAISLPVGLFWFAWTSYTSIHWAVGIVGTAFFGLGNVLLLTSVMNYLVDTYTLYAATASATNSIVRALFGAAFPLFTTYMYHNLGIQWASSVPAFLSLAFAPLPFALVKFGPALRARSKFAQEAKAQMSKLQEARQKVEEKIHHKQDEKLAADTPRTAGSDTAEESPV